MSVVATVVRWSGREARALREARRMTVRAFATHLGLAKGSVINWERRGELARLRRETQEILDRDLSMVDDDTRARFNAALTVDVATSVPASGAQARHLRTTVETDCGKPPDL